MSKIFGNVKLKLVNLHSIRQFLQRVTDLKRFTENFAVKFAITFDYHICEALSC